MRAVAHHTDYFMLFCRILGHGVNGSEAENGTERSPEVMRNTVDEIVQFFVRVIKYIALDDTFSFIKIYKKYLTLYLYLYLCKCELLFFEFL